MVHGAQCSPAQHGRRAHRTSVRTRGPRLHATVPIRAPRCLPAYHPYRDLVFFNR